MQVVDTLVRVSGTRWRVAKIVHNCLEVVLRRKSHTVVAAALEFAAIAVRFRTTPPVVERLMGRLTLASFRPGPPAAETLMGRLILASFRTRQFSTF